MTTASLQVPTNNDIILSAFERHLNGDYDYDLSIEPMPTPRPRSVILRKRKSGRAFIHVYNPPEYTEYKDRVAWLIKLDAGIIPIKDYKSLYIRFGIPYTKTERKKKLPEGQPHRKLFDLDNLCKGVLDAMQIAGLIKDDRIIFQICAMKVNTYSEGFIAFNIV